ncbi:hypothetical protein [Hungatella sp.]
MILKMRRHQFKLKEIQQYLILTKHSTDDRTQHHRCGIVDSGDEAEGNLF